MFAVFLFLTYYMQAILSFGISVGAMGIGISESG